jgi:hypothetical protein
VELAEQTAKADGETKDVQQRLEEAQAKIDENARIQREAEQARRRAIVGKANYSTTVVDPFDVFDLKPVVEHGYDREIPATLKQIELLNKAGIPTQGVSKKRAGQLIGELMRRWDLGECSFKQAKILAARGFDTRGVTHAKAKEIIDGIAQREGWGQWKGTVRA